MSSGRTYQMVEVSDMHDPIDILRDLVSCYEKPEIGARGWQEFDARIQDARKLIADFDDNRTAPDGRSRKMTHDDIEPGVVVRMLNWDGTASPFSDTVILREEKGWVRLARPYIYATGTQTCAPSPLTGVEDYKVTVESLLERFHVVLMSTGKVSRHTT